MSFAQNYEGEGSLLVFEAKMGVGGGKIAVCYASKCVIELLIEQAVLVWYTFTSRNQSLKVKNL